MTEISHRIQHAVWLYLRFTLSYRYVEELLAERGLVAVACRRITRARSSTCRFSAVHNTFNLQRRLVSRSTLRIFQAAGADQWSKAVAAV
jgi:hypothetical protein